MRKRCVFLFLQGWLVIVVWVVCLLVIVVWIRHFVLFDLDGPVPLRQMAVGIFEQVWK